MLPWLFTVTPPAAVTETGGRLRTVRLSEPVRASAFCDVPRLRLGEIFRFSTFLRFAFSMVVVLSVPMCCPSNVIAPRYWPFLLRVTSPGLLLMIRSSMA